MSVVRAGRPAMAVPAATPEVDRQPAMPAARSYSQRRAGGSILLAVVKRLAGALGVILSVLTVTFLVTRVFAPDPTTLFLGAAGNGYASPEAQAAARHGVQVKLGLDTSLPAQYVHFIGSVAHGDLGVSFQTGREVTSDLWDRLPATAELATYSLLFGVSAGVLGGVVAAVRRHSLFDRLSRLVMVGALAMPQFWIGLMLLWIFYTKLHLAPGPIGRLPVGVKDPPSVTRFFVVDSLLAGRWSTATDAAKQLVLPVLTLGLGLAGPIFKVVRTSMIEALTSDYVRSARALGFGRRRINLLYALKNGLLPIVTILAGVIAYTFCGSVLVEGIFSWTGVGNYSLRAISTSDFPAIQGFVVYGAILYVVIYEVLELVYPLVDPRARR